VYDHPPVVKAREMNCSAMRLMRMGLHSKERDTLGLLKVMFGVSRTANFWVAKRIRILLFVSWFLLVAEITRSCAQQIWLGPNIPHGSAAGAADWEEIFNPAAMPDTMSHVNVVILNQYALEGAPDDVLVGRFRFLHERNIKIMLPVQSIADTGSCGSSEGFEPPEQAIKLAGRMQRLKLQIDIIRLDEPVWFGIYDNDGYPPRHLPPCHYSPVKLANQVFLDVKEYLIDPAWVILDHAA
jgi:hypothetical protein